MYFDDMYVDRELSLKALDDSLPGIKPWITSDYQHSGLRDAGALIFRKLMDLSKN